jgi:hypothetical protein
LSPGQKATIAFTPAIMITVFNQAEIKSKICCGKDGNETGSDAMERDAQISLADRSQGRWRPMLCESFSHHDPTRHSVDRVWLPVLSR